MLVDADEAAALMKGWNGPMHQMPKARQRNLQKAMHVLSGKHGRFLARARKDGN